MNPRYDFIFCGLSLSSSWGNGHATTYRSLLKGLHSHGKQVLFLERDVPWYAANRDLIRPDYCDLTFYTDLDDLTGRFRSLIKRAGTVVIGSYVPQGIAVIDKVRAIRHRTLAFYDIDTPVTLEGLARGQEEYLARRQIPVFDIYFSFTGGPTLKRLEDDYGAQQAAALYCSADNERYRPTGETVQWDLGYLGTYSADRQDVLNRLLLEPARLRPDLSFVIAGSKYPNTIDWPSNVERLDHLAPEDHASFYGRQRFTLNVTRADMVRHGWSPSVRLFEAAACGTPIVSDIWPGIEDFFEPDKSIVLASDSRHVIEALDEYDEKDRRHIAASARATVLERHTGTARAGELIDTLATVHTQSPKRDETSPDFMRPTTKRRNTNLQHAR